MAKLYDPEEEQRRKDFGERLQKLRVSKKISQKDMAARLGLTPSAYAWYESGQREPSVKNLNCLAIFFGVSVDYLVNGTEKSDAQENTNDKFKIVENFWKSAGYEVDVSEDGTLSLILPDNFKTVFRLDDDNFVKSIDKKKSLKFENVTDFVRFTDPIQKKFRHKIEELRAELCNAAVHELYRM